MILNSAIHSKCCTALSKEQIRNSLNTTRLTKYNFSLNISVIWECISCKTRFGGLNLGNKFSYNIIKSLVKSYPLHSNNLSQRTEYILVSLVRGFVRNGCEINCETGKWKWGFCFDVFFFKLNIDCGCSTYETYIYCAIKTEIFLSYTFYKVKLHPFNYTIEIYRFEIASSPFLLFRKLLTPFLTSK